MICAPVAASIAVAIYVGWLLLISGVIGLIAIVSTHHVHAFLWSLVTAALSVAIGVMLVLMPVQGAISLTIVLTAFFIAVHAKFARELERLPEGVEVIVLTVDDPSCVVGAKIK